MSGVSLTGALSSFSLELGSSQVHLRDCQFRSIPIPVLDQQGDSRSFVSRNLLKCVQVVAFDRRFPSTKPSLETDAFDVLERDLVLNGFAANSDSSDIMLKLYEEAVIAQLAEPFHAAETTVRGSVEGETCHAALSKTLPDDRFQQEQTLRDLEGV